MHEPGQLLLEQAPARQPRHSNLLRELLERRIEEHSRAVTGAGILPRAEKPRRDGIRSKHQSSMQHATMLRYTDANRISF
jgi:hypothetical protein